MYVYYNNVNSIWAVVQRLQVNSSHLSALGAFLFIWNVILQCKHNDLTVAPLLLQNLLRKVTINTLAHSNENTGFFLKKDCVRHYVTIYDCL
jgi:hypothetical protein